MKFKIMHYLDNNKHEYNITTKKKDIEYMIRTNDRIKQINKQNFNIFF